MPICVDGFGAIWAGLGRCRRCARIRDIFPAIAERVSQPDTAGNDQNENDDGNQPAKTAHIAVHHAVVGIVILPITAGTPLIHEIASRPIATTAHHAIAAATVEKVREREKGYNEQNSHDDPNCIFFHKIPPNPLIMFFEEEGKNVFPNSGVQYERKNTEKERVSNHFD